MKSILMKGFRFEDYADRVEYPVLVEPKVDDIRCMVRVSAAGVEYLSYAGKPLHNLSRFDEGFKALSAEVGWTIFDCGIECNGNFNDSYRYVRSSKGVPKDLESAKLYFFLFDLPECINIQLDWRIPNIQGVALTAQTLEYFEIPMFPLRSLIVGSEDEVYSRYREFRERGFEGVMVKSLSGVYSQGKRTRDWLKVKPSLDFDGVIIQVIEAVSECGIRLGRAGSLRVRLEDGSEATPSGISFDLGRELWNNRDKYTNVQWIEFKCMERDRAGGYRHPVFVRLRESK